MQLFEVLLGVDRAARDTGRRIRITTFGEDRLSAALCAEETADAGLEDPAVMYTHAMRVTPLAREAAALAVAA